jgi:hypothetical protein
VTPNEAVVEEAAVALEKNKQFASICRLTQFKNVLNEFSNGNSKREQIIRLMKCKGKFFNVYLCCLSNSNNNTPCHRRKFCYLRNLQIGKGSPSK